jgi:ribose transport system substrate-binding protein
VISKGAQDEGSATMKHTSRAKRVRGIVAGVATVALLASACGGDDADDTDDVEVDEPADDAEEDDAELEEDEPDDDEPDDDADEDEDAEAAAGDGDFDIVLIPGVTGDEFYVSMECGALEAAEELGATLDVQGAPVFDPTEQIPVLESVVASGPDAILIAPTDVDALQAPLQEAVDAGIEVVLVDTTLSDPSLAVSQIGSDNHEGGRMAAEAVGELMGGEGAAMVVNVTPGISTTDARGEGFEEGIEELYPDITFLGQEYSDNEPAQAAEIVSATLAAEPELSGIFGANLFSAEGAATGIRQEGRDDVSIVGFDAGPAQIEQLREGLVQALIVQQPLDIGRQGVEQAVAALTGEETTPEIGTGFVTATIDNLDDDDVAEFLYRAEC